MTSQKYHVTEEGDLVIQNITKEDKGNYKCKATQLENGFTDFGWRVIQLKVERKKNNCHHFYIKSTIMNKLLSG